MKLEFRNVSKSYGKNKALQGFTATLEPCIYALLGPNGSGKSTLMNIITDNLKRDAGEILYSDGKEATEVLKMGTLFREKLGFMPQYPGMYPSFSVERFMWYMASLKGMEKEKAEKDIYEILSAVELEDVATRKIGALSGGMKQRLALAQAVLGDPEILILDEPTAGLDPKQRISVRNFISKIALNKIVIIATHVVSDIEFIARDVIMLKKGVVTDNAPPAELSAKIEGRVWSLDTTPDELPRLQAELSVVGIARGDRDGAVTARVISDTCPGEGAVSVSPTLEDYYLYVFGLHGSEE